jgi:hypothetical protein
MTTRGQKCCVSGISIDPEDQLQLNGRVMHLGLAKKWANTFGTQLFPDGTIVPETALRFLELSDDMMPSVFANNLIINQRFFLNKEFNDNITRALVGQYDAKMFTYLKVLMAWYIIIDPRKALEAFTNTMHLCVTAQEMPAGNRSETILSIINACLNSYFTDKNISDTIEAIDQQKMNSRISFTGLDAALSRYISQISSSEPALLSYIIDSRT